MKTLDVTLEPFSNLALDEALLLEAEAGRGGEILRFWESPQPVVVLGAGCRLLEDVDEAACLAGGVSILRRSSGGGTVLQGPGCLSYGLVLAYDRSPALAEIRSSYSYILGRMRDELAGLVPAIELAGTSDLAAAALKFSGNAQQRKRRHLLHHGTLLYDFDLTQIGRYLRAPARQPEYRHGRVHADFVTNLPATSPELKSRLRHAWQAADEQTVWPQDVVARLVADKYSRPEWVRRR